MKGKNGTVGEKTFHRLWGGDREILVTGIIQKSLVG